MWDSLLSSAMSAYSSYSAARTSGKVARIMNAANQGLYEARTRLNNANYALAVGATKIAQAEAHARIEAQRAQNHIAAANSMLAAQLNTIRTRTNLRHGQERLESQVEAAVRTIDAVQHRNLEQSIRGAEDWGRQTASLVSSGLVGAGIEALNAAMSLRGARMEQMQERITAQAGSDAAKSMQGIMSEALLGTDATTVGSSYQVVDRSGAVQLTPYKDIVTAPITQVGANTTDALLAGLFSNTQNWNTILGGLAQRSATPATTATPYSGGVVTGTPLPSFNWNFGSTQASPYQGGTVSGTALPSISLN